MRGFAIYSGLNLNPKISTAPSICRLDPFGDTGQFMCSAEFTSNIGVISYIFIEATKNWEGTSPIDLCFKVPRHVATS